MSYINTAKYPIPIFDRKNEDCQLWTRYDFYYAKHCNFGSAFQEDAEAPVGDTNLDRRGLLAAGYDEEDIDRHIVAWTFLVSALRSSEDRAILHGCKTPKEAWTNLAKWCGPQTQGTRTEYYRKIHSFRIAAGQNPSIVLGELEGVVAEMGTMGLAVDDGLLYTCFLDALHTKYEAEVPQLSGKTDLGGAEIMLSLIHI